MCVREIPVVKLQTNYGGRNLAAAEATKVTFGVLSG